MNYESDSDWLAQNTIMTLVGATILQPLLTPYDGDQIAGFRAKCKNGRLLDVWILCDPEGNGAGFLDAVDSEVNSHA
jgi:hypothetical protein